jgi:FkbM family methyltransferase
MLAARTGLAVHPLSDPDTDYPTMKSSFPTWRIHCLSEWLLNGRNRRAQPALLLNPGKYFFALLAKSIPNWHTKGIALQLRGGGAFSVHDFMALNIYHEIFVARCYDPVLPRGGTPRIIDVGSNIGLFALRAKQAAPDAIIACFEPFSLNFVRLRDNLARSQLTGVSCYREGIAGSCRRASLHINPTNAGGHSLKRQLAGPDTVDIDLIDLSTALDRMPGGRCDLLKLDCEGAEEEIIRSLTPELARRVERIIYEASPALYDTAELNSFLSGLGYLVSGTSPIFYASRA